MLRALRFFCVEKNGVCLTSLVVLGNFKNVIRFLVPFMLVSLGFRSLSRGIVSEALITHHLQELTRCNSARSIVPQASPGTKAMQ